MELRVASNHKRVSFIDTVLSDEDTDRPVQSSRPAWGQQTDADKGPMADFVFQPNLKLRGGTTRLETIDGKSWEKVERPLKPGDDSGQQVTTEDLFREFKVKVTSYDDLSAPLHKLDAVSTVRISQRAEAEKAAFSSMPDKAVHKPSVFEDNQRVTEWVQKSHATPTGNFNLKLLIAVLVCCRAVPVPSAAAHFIRIPVSQPLTPECLDRLRQRDNCPRETLSSHFLRPKFHDTCCIPYNTSTRYHCQEGTFDNGTQYLVQVCMAEVTVESGTTVKLVADDHGTPHFAISDCEYGYYEPVSRKSFEVLSPGCHFAKTRCNAENGQRLLRDGGKTADNLCDCMPDFLYVGHDHQVCRKGFSGDSVCECRQCPEGHTRDEKNSCVPPSSDRDIFTLKPNISKKVVTGVTNDKASRHTVSTRSVDTGHHEVKAQSAFESAIGVTAGIAVLVLFLAGLLALFCSTRVRDTVGLCNGLGGNAYRQGITDP